jgi:hypothetical protein
MTKIIENLIETYSKKESLQSIIAELNSSKVDTTLLRYGDELIQIKREIKEELETGGKIVPEKIEAELKSIFTKIKKQTAQEIKAFDVTTINKVVKISENEIITKYRNEKKLPDSWGSLTLLTSLANDEIQKLVEENEISNDSTRSQLMEVVKKTKGETITTKKSNVVTLIKDDGAVNEKDLLDLEELLKDFGWIVKKNIKDNASKKSKAVAE